GPTPPELRRDLARCCGLVATSGPGSLDSTDEFGLLKHCGGDGSSGGRGGYLKKSLDRNTTSVRGNLLLRPVELGSVDPHAVQNDCQLARDRDFGLSEAIALGEPHPPSL